MLADHTIRALTLTTVGITLLALAGCSAPAPEFEPVQVGSASAEETPPGTELAIGETAWLLPESGDGSGMLVGATVREIRKLDPAKIPDFEDNSEFDGYTPFAVVVQYDWTPASDVDGRILSIPVLPIGDDGQLKEWVANSIGNIAMGDAKACGIVLPAFESGSGVALECFVALSKSGPVVGAVYNGTSRNSTFVDTDHLYAETPITWRE